MKGEETVIVGTTAEIGTRTAGMIDPGNAVTAVIGLSTAEVKVQEDGMTTVEATTSREIGTVTATKGITAGIGVQKGVTERIIIGIVTEIGEMTGKEAGTAETGLSAEIETTETGLIAETETIGIGLSVGAGGEITLTPARMSDVTSVASMDTLPPTARVFKPAYSPSRKPSTPGSL